MNDHDHSGCSAHPESQSPASGRRLFLRDSGVAILGLSMVPGFLQRAALAAVPENGRQKVLVVVFQRGGADGLNIIVPHGDPSYYEYRPTIAIKRPGTGAGAALDLDGYFGFHPALAPLKSLFDGGDLAIVHAVGSPDTSRSHFQAQEYMESAAPGQKRVRDGWLNRYLQTNPTMDPTAFRGTAIGALLPRSLRGDAPAIAMSSLAEFQALSETSLLKSLYAEDSNTLVSGTARDMYDALDLLKAANLDQYRPAAGVRYPTGQGEGFGRQLRQVAQLIKGDVGLEIAFVDIGGWDHHTDEGNVGGRMAQSLAPVAQGLDAFTQDLGARMEDVVILTMSEFGRTARENGNRGTDHGHGNVMFVIGGGIKGGKVYGDWPGLAREQLNEDRDLALTTDFRDVFAELLVGHLGCKNIDAVFPDFTVNKGRFKGLV